MSSLMLPTNEVLSYYCYLWALLLCYVTLMQNYIHLGKTWSIHIFFKFFEYIFVQLLRRAEEVAGRRTKVHPSYRPLRGLPRGRRGETPRDRPPINQAFNLPLSPSCGRGPRKIDTRETRDPREIVTHARFVTVQGDAGGLWVTRLTWFALMWYY